MKILFVCPNYPGVQLALSNDSENRVTGQAEVPESMSMIAKISEIAQYLEVEKIVVGRKFLRGMATQNTDTADRIAALLPEYLVKCKISVESWDLKNVDIIDVEDHSFTMGAYGVAAQSSQEAVYYLRCYLTLMHSGQI